MSTSKVAQSRGKYRLALLSAPGILWLILLIALGVGMYAQSCLNSAESIRRASIVKCLTNLKHDAFVLSLAVEKGMRERTYISDMYQRFSVLQHKSRVLASLVNPLDSEERSASADVQSIIGRIQLATEDFGNAASKTPEDGQSEDKALSSYGASLKEFFLVCDKLHEYERMRSSPAESTAFGVIAGVILLFVLIVIVRKDLKVCAQMNSDLTKSNRDLLLAESLVEYQCTLFRSCNSISETNTDLGESFRRCVDLISAERPDFVPRINVEDTVLETTANRDTVESIISKLLRMSLQSSATNVSTIIKAREAENAMVAISVRSFGDGMDPQLAECVFHPWKLPADHRGRTDYGLAAAETRALALSSGGDMSVLSQPGSGTEFIVLLPRA